MKNKTITLIVIFMLSITVLTSKYITQGFKLPFKNYNKESVATPTPNPDNNKFETYNNDKFGISFSYPTSWQGPEIYDYDSGFIFEIGTDKVYPYGTILSEKKYTKQNSYYITIQFNKKPDNQTANNYLKKQSWLKSYMDLAKLNDNEIKIIQNTEYLKIRNLEIGNFSGYEMLSSLNKTEQTNLFYVREIFLIDEFYNSLKITGYPNNVTLDDVANWKNSFQKIDQKYSLSFHKIVNSLKFTNQ